MTPEEHTEAWRNNIRAKSQEIQQLLNKVFSLLPTVADETKKPVFEKSLKNVIEKTKAMHHLYGPNHVPLELQQLTGNLLQWESNLQNPTVTRKIFELWGPIGKINGEDEKTDDISFSTILEKHKQDKALQECLKELIAALKELLEKGDAILSKQVATELEKILAELKKRKDQSVFDLHPWIEFALVSATAIIDTYTNTPIAAIAYAALIAAKKSQIRVGDLFKQAHLEYTKSLNLKLQDRRESPFVRKVQAATLEEIETAAKNSEGLKNLPESIEKPALTAPHPSKKM